MTLLTEEEINCSLCGRLSRQTRPQSTNACGPADFDGRPPPQARYLLQFLQRCPDCGWCSWDLGGECRDGRVVGGNAYQRQLNDPAFPELANRFLCRSLIEEKHQAWGEAAYQSLQAAWVCDDEGRDGAAGRARRRALGLFAQARAAGERLAAIEPEVLLNLADTCRRIGAFSEASYLCQEALQLVRAGLAYFEAGAATPPAPKVASLLEEFARLPHNDLSPPQVAAYLDCLEQKLELEAELIARQDDGWHSPGVIRPRLEATATLKDRLADPHPAVRRDAVAELLALVQDGANAEGALPDLLGALKDREPTVRLEAARALASAASTYPDAATAWALGEGLRDPHEPVRAAVRQALMRRADDLVLPVLLAAVRGSNPAARAEAARALWFEPFVTDRRVRRALADLAADPDETVRRCAQMALERAAELAGG